MKKPVIAKTPKIVIQIKSLNALIIFSSSALIGKNSVKKLIAKKITPAKTLFPTQWWEKTFFSQPLSGKYKSAVIVMAVIKMTAIITPIAAA